MDKEKLKKIGQSLINIANSNSQEYDVICSAGANAYLLNSWINKYAEKEDNSKQVKSLVGKAVINVMKELRQTKDLSYGTVEHEIIKVINEFQKL